MRRDTLRDGEHHAPRDERCAAGHPEVEPGSIGHLTRFGVVAASQSNDAAGCSLILIGNDVIPFDAPPVARLQRSREGEPYRS